MEGKKVSLSFFIQSLCDGIQYKMPNNIPLPLSNQVNEWHVVQHRNCMVVYKKSDVNRIGQVKAGQAPIFTLWSK